MRIISKTPEITFDDVLLLPNHSDILKEEETKKISLKTRISKNITLDIPIVSAPMPSVTEVEMAITIGKLGGIGFLHFFQSFDRQIEQITKIKKAKVKVAAGVADLSKNGKKHVGNLLKVGTDLISVETYHAQNKQLIRFVKDLKKTFRGIEICAGYLVTAGGTEELIKAGADSIRVGIGGGSHCTTRLVTGIGRPQLSAVADCYKATKKYGIPLISDTGIRHAGDIPKAVVFGADCVMIGGLFAGTDEAPGEIIKKDGNKYKYSLGMCTDIAMTQSYLQKKNLHRRVKNLLNKSVKNNLKNQNKLLFEEGVEGLVEYKGSVKTILTDLIAGIRRSMWYQGVKNLTQLREKARVVIVSSSTKLENNPRI